MFVLEVHTFRLGFQDPDRAIDLIAAGPAARGINADVLAALADAADPDAALLSLTRIIDAADAAGLAEDFIQALLTDETIQRGTAGVRGEARGGRPRYERAAVDYSSKQMKRIAAFCERYAHVLNQTVINQNSLAILSDMVAKRITNVPFRKVYRTGADSWTI